MKIFILVLFVLISQIESRLRDNNNDDDDDDIYQLDDLLNDKYNRHRYRVNKQQYDDDDDDQYIPPSIEVKKTRPTHKKVHHNDEEDTEDSTKIVESDSSKIVESDSSSICLDKYAMHTEQLVKVKELKNGAHMIRYVLLDKRTLSSNFNLKEHCMMNCCLQKTCDLAMLSEQPTHDGYKCYLFACNGSCPLASHQDYTIMFPKEEPKYYIKSLTTKIEEKITSTTTTSTNVNLSKKKSFFRETSVIIFLIFGVISTIILFVFLFRQYRESQKRSRKSKNYTVDADYLINGLYL